MMQFVCAFSIIRAVRLIVIEEVERYGKLCLSETFLKMVVGECTTLIPLPGHKLQKPSKSLAYFSHLSPLVLFFFTKRQSKRGEPWHIASPPKYAPDEKTIIQNVVKLFSLTKAFLQF